MYTSPLNVAVIILAGTVTGAIGAILGIGGGVFLIPLLVLGVGVPMHYAVATSIVAIIATSSAVASTNIERGTANIRLGMTLEVATSLGAIAGGLTAGWLAAQLMEGLFGLLLIPTAIVMWRGKAFESGAADGPQVPKSDSVAIRSAAGGEPIGALGGSYLDEGEGRVVAYRVRRLGAGWRFRLSRDRCRASWASAAECSKCRRCTYCAAYPSRRPPARRIS